MAAPGGDNNEGCNLIFSTLSILQIIKDAQQQHGLRHGDYQRYRQYCGRRVGRVRRSVHYTHAHKYAGKNTKFVARKVNAPEVVTDVKFLLVPLFDAERDWSYAMQLKQDAAQETASSRTKFHMIKKLKKAAQHSANLESLCKALDAVDPATKLEAQAYHAWMTGCLRFEMHHWTKAAEAFSTAKKIYDSLCSVVKDEQLIDAYRQRCAEMQPQLRYCAYETGDTSALADLMEMKLTTDDPLQTDLDKLIAATRAREAESRRATVQWCGHEIKLEQPEQAAQLHTLLLQFDQRLNDVDDYEQKIEMYEKLLIECRDAVQAVRDHYKQEQLKSHRAQGDDASLSSAQLLHSYLTYARLIRTVQKYLLMINHARSSTKCKPVDMVRLYDNLLQSIQEIEVLPGVQSDQQFVATLGLKLAYHKTFRCYYVAQTYAGLKRWEEALAMYDRCAQRLGHVKLQLANTKLSSADQQQLSTSGLDQLDEQVRSGKYAVLANRLYGEDTEAHDAQSRTPIDKPLTETPSEYRQLTTADLSRVQIVPMPPKFEPMPSKPLFFDLALNHVKMPDLEAYMNVPDAPKSSASPPSTTGSKASKKAAAAGGKGGQQQQQQQATEADGKASGWKGWFWGSS